MKARVKTTGEIIEVKRILRGIYGRVDIAQMYSRASLDFITVKPRTKNNND